MLKALDRAEVDRLHCLMLLGAVFERVPKEVGQTQGMKVRLEPS